VSHIEATAARNEIGDATRQQITDLLTTGPATTKQIAAAIHLGYDGANHHLRKLELAELVTRGRFTPGVGREWMLA
jgi:predicted ArsR family transcriptional regulator